MRSYKLVYFNGKGRAETIRLAFVASGIKFEDKRIEKDEWATLKPTTFSGQVPYLEVDGKVIIESMSIARYVGREAGLMGKCSSEQAKVESIVDVINGLLEKAVEVKYLPDGPEKEALAKDFLEKHYPKVTELLEKFMGDKSFLAFNEISLADLHFFSAFEMMDKTFVPWEKSNPKLKALFDKVAAQPKIAEYLKSRPVTNF